MRLVEVSQNYPRTPNDGAPVLEFTYETLTGSYVQDADDKVDHELNGLRRVTRTVIATEDSNYAKVVGTDTIDHTGRGYGSETLTLASAEEVPKKQNEGGFTRIQETWVASGTLSETLDNVGSQQAKVIETIGADPATPSGYSLASKQESNFEGFQTNRFTFLKPSVLSRNISTRSNGNLIIETVEAFNETPSPATSGAVQIGNDVSNVEGIPTRRFTFAKGEGTIRTSTRPGQIPGTTEKTVISYGTEVVPPGELIASSETQEDGYVQYINTAIQGQITGTKQTYTDVVQVEVPGEVECATENVSISDSALGQITGTIAIPKVTPRRSKKIEATVKVEITSSPPNTGSLAYDLGEISCSVTSINQSYSSKQGPTKKSKVGIFITQYTDWSRSYSPSARIQTYPGSFLTVASSSGTVSYASQQFNILEPDEDEDGYGDGLDSTVESSALSKTECIGEGSTSAVGYATTGILKRNSRPVLTALNGTTYYEVITWSV
jgi:hypothetical protein